MIMSFTLGELVQILTLIIGIVGVAWGIIARFDAKLDKEKAALTTKIDAVRDILTQKVEQNLKDFIQRMENASEKETNYRHTFRKEVQDVYRETMETIMKMKDFALTKEDFNREMERLESRLGRIETRLDYMPQTTRESENGKIITP